MQWGQSEWFADALTELFTPHAHGSQSAITTAMADVAKKQPVTFNQFTQDYASVFKG
jgi:hypothetical protein